MSDPSHAADGERTWQIHRRSPMPGPRERLPGRPDGYPPNRSSRLIVRPRTTRVTQRVSGGPEEEFDRTMSAKYRMCRIFGRAWEYTTARRNKGEYVRGLVCIRCRVQRSMRIDARDGDRLGSGGYDYHDARGYLLKGGGALTADERSELGLAEIAGHLQVGTRRRRAV
jgi:hypothetical protein